MSKQYDFVAVGDIVIDAFIQLSKKDATVRDDTETGRKTLSMNFGDKLPYENVTIVNAVGNSPNAAVSAHRLGLNTALVTNLGNDRWGKDCLDTLRQEGVHTDLVKVHEGKRTNYHYVLRYGAERTILINHEKYNYQLPNFDTPPRYMYFSSIGEHAVDFHDEIVDYITKTDTKLVFQPGTFQIRLGAERLKHVYNATDIFFCNKEEAMSILETEERDVPTLIRRMKELGPRLPVITDGPAGAFVVDDNDTAWHMPMYPDPAPPVDRTGAGDSFSSTFTTAIALGHDPATALTWGPVNSMNVVQYIGAQEGLLTREKLQDLLDNRPDEYQSRKLD